MFLTQKTYDLNNFLSALNFIAPKGMSVAYFITPKEGVLLPDNSGFEVQVLDTPEDESITYARQQPVQKQDQAITPADYSVFDPGKLGRRQPTPNILPPVTEPEQLESPFVQVLSESLALGTDIKLLENYMMFPKNTVFHCEINKLKEKKDIKVNKFESIYEKSIKEGLIDDARERAKDPVFRAKMMAKRAALEQRKADREERKKRIFTFNQIARMMPDGVEPEFLETRTPFVFDIKIGDKIFKKISRPGAKIEKYILRETEWHKKPGVVDYMMNDFRGPDEIVKNHKIGLRHSNGVGSGFPNSPTTVKIQQDAWNLYKEGYSEEEIVEEMLTQQWYQNLIDKKKFSKEDLTEYVTDWVREKAYYQS
jgi:hypothetical protein